MPDDQAPNDRTAPASIEEVQKQLAVIFGKMPFDIPLVLFTAPGQNEYFRIEPWNRARLDI